MVGSCRWLLRNLLRAISVLTGPATRPDIIVHDDIAGVVFNVSEEYLPEMPINHRLVRERLRVSRLRAAEACAPES